MKKKSETIEIDPSKLTGARKLAQPKEFRPQLCTLIKKPSDAPKWLHEIKFDGYRFLAFLQRGRARLCTRNGNDWTGKFSKIAKAIEALGLKQGILDGEVVVVKPDGTTSFQALQNFLKKGRAAELTFYVFDLPHCEGYNLTRSPLIERKALLRKVLERGGVTSETTIRYSEHIEGKGSDFFEQACLHGVEGIVSKEADCGYEQKRTKTWTKIKCSNRQEFVIGGYTDPQHSRSFFGALLVGYYEGQKLMYCGRVGTGFDEALLKSLHGQMKDLERGTPPFANPPRGREARGVHWIEPKLVGEVEFTEMTEDGILRHPSFQGLREDKKAEDVKWEKEEKI